MHDQQIIELIRSDNHDKALVGLYKFFPMTRKIVLSNSGNAQDAEDIFQESLIIFCRKAKDPGFQLTSKLGTYLYSVSRFLWKDELKRRIPYSEISLDTGFSENEEKDLENMMMEENRVKLAEQILNEMGERCRELLLLFYKSGLKLKDIASRMGYSSENAAKNQKYKCIEGARNKLKEMEQSIQTF